MKVRSASWWRAAARIIATGAILWVAGSFLLVIVVDLACKALLREQDCDATESAPAVMAASAACLVAGVYLALFFCCRAGRCVRAALARGKASAGRASGVPGARS